MKEEKMAILKMVEDGKITADDAVKLMSAMNSGSAFSDVKEKLSSLTKDAKPVVKKAANMAKTVAGGIAEGAKKSADVIGVKVTEIKNRPRKADFNNDVVAEPVSEAAEDITDKVEVVEEKAEDIAEAVKDKAEDIKDKAEDIAEDVKDKAEDIAEDIKDKTE